MDGVGMAQEFVLVNVNSPIQYLWRPRQTEKERDEHIAMDIWYMYKMAENQYFKVNSNPLSQKYHAA